jgi:hypothetical protein
VRYGRTMMEDVSSERHPPSDRRILVSTLAILVALGSIGVYFALRTETRCATLVPDCKMKRLPDRTLTGGERSGALGAIAGGVPGNLISFDEALVRAWHEDGHAATSVQVTLGTADAAANHWESQSRYFYGIEWFGVCSISIGGGRIQYSASPSPPGPCDDTWGTVIDATNGAFVVGGS